MADFVGRQQSHNDGDGNGDGDEKIQVQLHEVEARLGAKEGEMGETRQINANLVQANLSLVHSPAITFHPLEPP